MAHYKIIRIESQLMDEARSLTLNFVYRKMIIGEIVLKYGEAPGTLQSTRFMCDLSNARTLGDFKLLVLEWCNKLAENG